VWKSVDMKVGKTQDWVRAWRESGARAERDERFTLSTH